jgi:hypothetical protein
MKILPLCMQVVRHLHRLRQHVAFDLFAHRREVGFVVMNQKQKFHGKPSLLRIARGPFALAHAFLD